MDSENSSRFLWHLKIYILFVTRIDDDHVDDDVIVAGFVVLELLD